MKPSKIGGGFMNQYNIIVQQLLAYLTKRKQCSSSRLSHKQCYEEFGQYLEENNLYLSQEAADQWIASIQGKYNRQKCYFWRQYISQLIVFQTTGSIPDTLFYQIQSSYDKVPDSLKYYLDLYLENCRSRYTDRSFEIAKVHCSRIMYYLSEQGITEIQEIFWKLHKAAGIFKFHCQKRKISSKPYGRAPKWIHILAAGQNRAAIIIFSYRRKLYTRTALRAVC